MFRTVYNIPESIFDYHRSLQMDLLWIRLELPYANENELWPASYALVLWRRSSELIRVYKLEVFYLIV